MKRNARLLVLFPLLRGARCCGRSRSPGWRVASLRPGQRPARSTRVAVARAGPFSLANFADAWRSGHFPLWYLNTDAAVRRHPGGAVRHRQPGRLRLRAAAVSAARNRCSTLFLLQLMLVPPILIVPNLSTLVRAWPLRHAAGRHGAVLRLGLRRVPDAPDLPHHPARLRGSRAGRRRHPPADHLARAAAAGAARPGRLRDRFGHVALERVPVAADGDLLAGQPGADGGPRVASPRAPRPGRNGA